MKSFAIGGEWGSWWPRDDISRSCDASGEMPTVGTHRKRGGSRGRAVSNGLKRPGQSTTE